MKKFLFATTALVASAGFAAADVSISARAEMGIAGGSNDNAATLTVDESETRFFTDIDVTFSLSGEADNGLSFGAAVDLDEGGAGSLAVANNDDDGGVAIFISADGAGTLTMGDTDGALDWALTEAGNISNGGSIADDETSHAGYNGSYLDGLYDGQIARYDNTFGDFGVAISIEMDDGSGAAGTTHQDNGYAIGFRYSADLGGTTVNVGLGYQVATFAGAPGGAFAAAGYATGNEIKAIGLSANASFGDFSAGIAYTDFSGPAAANDLTHTGVGVGYSANGLTVHANYGIYNLAAAGADREGFGLSLAYDLGGGAVVHAGYGSSKIGAAASTDTFSLGLGLSF